MISCYACDSNDKYIGIYMATDHQAEKDKDNVIELMENGEGLWGCCQGEVSFTWYVKGKELRINTKEGGIMVGKLEKESFTIVLPGKKKLRFIKQVD